MELDEYKIASKQKDVKYFPYKAIPELESRLHRKTESLIDSIEKNLQLEIVFALLFLLFDGYILFSPHTQLRVVAVLLLVFCLYFTYYLFKLLKFIQFQQVLLPPVKQ